MKILIAYASAGAGHLKAAEAVYNYFKECCLGTELKLVDVLEESTSFFSLSYRVGYVFLVRYATFVWRIAFWLTSWRLLRPLSRTAASLLNYLNSRPFRKLLIKEKADFIISTHFLPSEISAYLKRRNKINSRIISVITDFGVHPFWVSKGTDMYIVASAFSRDSLIKEGVAADKIKELGIPTDAKFNKQYDRAALAEALNIDGNIFTVLVVTGSFGIGPISRIVKLLHDDVQVLVVCARNKKLFEELRDKNYPNTKVFGFVDNIQELMSVSDVIITKPGGLGISELLVKELVPIFISAIPGQEEINAAVLESYGIGIRIRCPEDIKKAVLDLKLHPDKLKQRKDKIRLIKKPFAVREICNVICPGSIGPGC